jgi:hypothetical protein
MTTKTNPRPWDNEPTPLTDANARSDTDYHCSIKYHADGEDIDAGICSEIERRMRHAEQLLDEVLATMNNSTGVAGWHLNGDIADWDEFEDRQMIEQYLAAAKEADNERKA